MNTDLITLGTFVTSLGTLIVAFFALHSWKQQFNKNLLKEFVLETYDSVNKFADIHYQLIQILVKFEEDQNIIINTEFFSNPITENHQNMIKELDIVIPKIDQALNRLLALNNSQILKNLANQYLSCIHDIGMFYISAQLVGYKHPELQKINVKRWSILWLDKASDEHFLLKTQLEEQLIKLLKI